MLSAVTTRCHAYRGFPMYAENLQEPGNKAIESFGHIGLPPQKEPLLSGVVEFGGGDVGG